MLEMMAGIVPVFFMSKISCAAWVTITGLNTTVVFPEPRLMMVPAVV
jgi:hypothetical protein